MSPLRSAVSMIAALVFGAAAAGCYDLSAPSGPHPEDFVQNQAPAEPGDQASAEQGGAAQAAPTAPTISEPVRSLNEETALRLALPADEEKALLVRHEAMREASLPPPR